MKNNLVLITGGTGHIGEAIAKEFANQKSDLILIDINKKHLEKTKLMIEKTYNVSVHTYDCDMSNYKQLNSLTTKLLKKFTIIDTIINSKNVIIYNYYFILKFFL